MCGCGCLSALLDLGGGGGWLLRLGSDDETLLSRGARPGGRHVGQRQGVAEEEKGWWRGLQSFLDQFAECRGAYGEVGRAHHNLTFGDDAHNNARFFSCD